MRGATTRHTEGGAPTAVGPGILMPLCFLFAVLGDVQALLAIARSRRAVHFCVTSDSVC